MEWGKYTQEQAQRGGRIGGRIGGLASVETNGEQMRNGGLASCAAQRKAAPSDTNYLMANGFTKPTNWLQQTSSSGGRTDSKPETKKAKKFHPNTENEDGLNTRGEEKSQRQSLQLQQALERTCEEHKVQHMEEVLQLGPAVGFMAELLGAEPLGYNLGYTDGWNAALDTNVIGLAAKQQEVGKAKSRLQKKRAVAEVLNIEIGCRSYTRGRFKRQWDQFLLPTPKYGWMPHNASFGFLDRPRGVLGQIHFLDRF
jgi:hypothetical protein